MWLEGNGHVDFLEHINAFDDNHVSAIASSAKSFIEGLHLEPSDSVNRSTPNTLFQEEVMEGIAFYLNNFCYKVLGDLFGKAKVNELIRQIGQAYQGHLKDQFRGLIANLIEATLLIHKDHGEGTSSSSTQSPACQILQTIMEGTPLSQSTNRLAEILETSTITEKQNDGDKLPNQHDERTLLVTFSSGHPLTEDELHDFFMRNYGDVEEISLEEPVEPSHPLHGLVKFFSQETLLRVLDGNKRVKFMISGKHLWARKYVPK